MNNYYISRDATAGRQGNRAQANSGTPPANCRKLDCSSDDEEPSTRLVSATQQPREMLKCSFVKSKRFGAKPRLLDEDNYIYTWKGKGRKTNIVYYVCSHKYQLACKASAVYNTDEEGYIQRLTDVHTHPPNFEELRASIEEITVLESMVNSLSTQQLKPRHILSKIVSNLEKDGCGEAVAYVSKKEVIRGRARRLKIKTKLTLPDKVPTTWEELKTSGFPDEFHRLKSGSQFLR